MSDSIPFPDVDPPRSRWLPVAGAALLLLVALPAAAGGHAVVHPVAAPPGAYQKYVLRVPNERDVATTRVTLVFPEEVRVVSFAEVPGWALTVDRDRAGRVVRAVWEGELPVGRFVEFPFVAVNPAEEARVRWNATQTYAGGDVVEWDGPEGSDMPASFTAVREPDRGGSDPAVLWLGAGALLLSLLALGSSLRPSDAESHRS